MTPFKNNHKNLDPSFKMDLDMKVRHNQNALYIFQRDGGLTYYIVFSLLQVVQLLSLTEQTMHIECSVLSLGSYVCGGVVLYVPVAGWWL